jgi:formate dehydrogenase major subunit
MARVKLEIDGRRVSADADQTILDAARGVGIGIPTLCHDRQLEPFASCYVCVVKVKGARGLLPACSTKVAHGMVVETNSLEVRQSRKAALELLLSDHYADCVGPCQLACPAGIDIQGYIALAAIGKYREAIALVKQHNPLPSVCGRVCTRPCEVSGCRRTLLDEPVGIDYIKRYIADLDLSGGDTWRPEPAPVTGKRVAVVGAGPAGLSAAYYLAVRGHAVSMFEAQPEPGGMLRYGIPEYRLPKQVLDLEIDQILGLGATLQANQVLGRDFTIASLRDEGFDAVFLGIGAWRSSLMRVENEDAAGVVAGIDFLRDVGLGQPMTLRGTVAVVGGGNTAIDCARTALRLGASTVKLLYRRTRAEMPANDTEIQDAIEEGVEIEFLVAPTRVVPGADGRLRALECQRMELGAPDASGRRSPRPVRGSEHEVACDMVIAAIGQSATIADLLGKVPGLLPAGESMGLTRWQTVEVDPRTLETTVEGVFSGGDVVTGAATAIEAIAAGRKAAYAIDTYVREGRARPEPEPFLSRKDVFSKITIDDLRSRESKPRRVMPLVPVGERVKGFAEVELGYSDADLHEEATRCLECGCVALFDCDLRKYATDYGVEVTRFLGEARQHERDVSHPLIELDRNKCILCGRCVRMCSDVVGVSAFGFVNRGFGTIVAPALGGSLLEAGCISCGLCIGTCPTGAIAERLSLAKPGPWKTDRASSVCTYCSVGCRLTFESLDGTMVKATRREDDRVVFGTHCWKGRFGFHHLGGADRLTRGIVRENRSVSHLPVEDAITVAADRLKAALAGHQGDEVAVFVSPRMTNEEIYLAQKLARGVLGTHHVASFGTLVNQAHFAPEAIAGASYQDVAAAGAVIVAGASLARERFALHLAVARAARNGASIVWIGAETDRTADLADVYLHCRPGTEPLVAAGIAAAGLRRAGDDLSSHPELARVASLTAAQWLELAGVEAGDLERAAEQIGAASPGVLVFDADFRGERRTGDARTYAAVARTLGCALLPAREAANAQGLLDMGGHPAWLPGYLPLAGLTPPVPDLAWHLADRRIKVAIVLGEDPLGSSGMPDALRDGLTSAELLIAADLFPTATTAAAHVVLPLSSSIETSGTMTNAERRVQRLRRIVPPRAGLETWQVLSALARAAGAREGFAHANTAEVFDEIRQAAPIYRQVVVDGEGPEGIWDASAFPLPRVPAVVAASAAALPVPTSTLDVLDARFTAWFAGILPPR